MLVCLERGVNGLHMVYLMPLPPHHLLLQWNPEWFTFLVPAYPGLSWKRPLNRCISINRTCHILSNNNTTTTTVLRPFVRDYPGEPEPEETLTHPPSWPSSSLYQLLPSTTMHSILLVQITCLAVFLHNLFPCPRGHIIIIIIIIIRFVKHQNVKRLPWRYILSSSLIIFRT